MDGSNNNNCETESSNYCNTDSNDFSSNVNLTSDNDNLTFNLTSVSSSPSSETKKDLSLVSGEPSEPVSLASVEKWRILKNVVIFSLAFMVHFTAFQGAANLQSSINAEAGLGTASLASIYASLIISNLFLPVVLIRWIGCKWTAALSFIFYMPYIAAQFYPRFYTMIPAGICVGIGGGPLWCAKCTYLSVFYPRCYTMIPAGICMGKGGGPLCCAKCTYLSVVAEAYEKVSGIPSEVLVVRFFGIFFMIFQFAQVWGNLISSLVLTSGDGNTGGPSVNVSLIPELCGANFLASDSSEALPPQPIEKIQTIAGIYLGCMAIACLIVAFGVDSLSRYEKYRNTTPSTLSGFKLVASTMKILKEKNQLLLLGMTGWLGMCQAFLGADFTASYVACAWGTGRIGYVMICYGVCNSISAITTGSLVKITGRLPVVLSAMALHIGILIALLIWKPSPDTPIVFFVMSGLWGVCEGVWLVQINALCGIMFPGREEAAYSNFRIWESLGFIIAYVYSPYLRTKVKIYILLVLLILAMTGYTTLEVGEIKKKRRAKVQRETLEGGKMNKGFVKED